MELKLSFQKSELLIGVFWGFFTSGPVSSSQNLSFDTNNVKIGECRHLLIF
jgi:hypothetical protein